MISTRPAGDSSIDGHRVRDRVRHPDELDVERADRGPLAGLRLAQLGRAEQPVLVELGLDQAEREPRRPHLRDADLAQEVRQRTHVVLVAVREEDRAHALGVVAQVAHVGEDQVDAEMLVAREGEARVDDDDLAAGLEDGHVLSDLSEAAERDDPQSVLRHPRSLVGACEGPRLRAGETTSAGKARTT